MSMTSSSETRLYIVQWGTAAPAAMMVCVRVLLILSAQMVQQLYDAITIFDGFLCQRRAVQERERYSASTVMRYKKWKRTIPHDYSAEMKFIAPICKHRVCFWMQKFLKIQTRAHLIESTFELRFSGINERSGPPVQAYQGLVIWSTLFNSRPSNKYHIVRV